MHASDTASAWEFLHFRDKIAIRDSPYNESAVAQSLLALLTQENNNWLTHHKENTVIPEMSLFRCATLGSSA